jgi:dynein heavy chain
VANPDLPSLPRHILVALITTDVHARDIVQELWREQITSVDDFTWKKQLRYYYELDDQIKA